MTIIHCSLCCQIHILQVNLMSNVYGVVSQESGRTGLVSFLFVNRNLLQNEAGQLKVSDFGLLGSHIRSITSSSSDINACEYSWVVAS